jgi:phosphopantothenoylcysteine decarboxylase/phosphopantothenate--cysteine ligase
VVPTAAALRFVGAPTWAALSGQPVATDVWTDAQEVPHVRLGRHAELVVVAPATADLLARAAHGLADDLLTNTLLTARCPIVYAPAMHTEMWEHPATVENVAVLRRRGAIVLEPAIGRLTGADTGKGRLPEPPEIFAAALAAVAGRPRADRPRDLAGRHVVVTAGGTREPIDPVRFIGNRSSGKQGYAFARTAVGRGARVTLISANVTLDDPAGVAVVRVGSTEDMRKATVEAAADADAVVMAAAPADFRPARYEPAKIKKSGGEAPVLHLTTNPDIAAELGERKPAGQVLVVFAAETFDGSGSAAPHPGGPGTVMDESAALASARAKLARKRADLIVLNAVGPDKTFGSDRNAAIVLDGHGGRTDLLEQSKDELSNAVWDLVVAKWTGSGGARASATS